MSTIRIKFVKNHKQYKKGDVENVSPNEAFGLIDSGKAVVSKDMNESDYQASASTALMPKRSITTKEK